jgi:hypothetical protein
MEREGYMRRLLGRWTFFFDTLSSLFSSQDTPSAEEGKMIAT